MASSVEVTFLGRQIPLEVKRLVAITPLFSDNTLTKVIQVVVEYLSGTGDADLAGASSTSSSSSEPGNTTNSRISALNAQLEAELEQNKSQVKKAAQREHVELAQQMGLFPVIFTGFYCILRAAIRTKLNAESFAEQLNELQFSAPVVRLLAKTLKDKRELFEKIALDNSSWYNRVVNVRWRVDVTISSSSMLRVFKPVILLQLELSDGRVRMMELSLEQFHKLRHSVASVLNHIHILMSHPIMKIEEKL
eukprot:GEZU01039189.1.p1 GENE.GEZU01039189.1~~GEZU01039189.1.p1  ORF type:complete len:250 (-),score=62.71 GEZU01039189.1:77-826(-)